MGQNWFGNTNVEIPEQWKLKEVKIPEQIRDYTGAPIPAKIPPPPAAVKPTMPNAEETLKTGLGKAFNWATTPIAPEFEEAENATVEDVKKKFGGFAGKLADWEVKGISSPAGIATLGAGVPFIKMAKKLGINKLYHGTPHNINMFDIAKNDPTDTLGYMIHAAEEPEYAATYAFKKGDPANKAKASWLPGYKVPEPNVIPIVPKAENVLDITDFPEGEDLDKVAEALRMWNPEQSALGSRERLTSSRAKQLLDEIEHVKKLKGRKDLTADQLMGLEAYKTSWLNDARIPFNNPEITEKMGFDAIRYNDVHKKAWAFPNPEILETPWGTKLGQKQDTKKIWDMNVSNLRKEQEKEMAGLVGSGGWTKVGTSNSLFTPMSAGQKNISPPKPKNEPFEYEIFNPKTGVSVKKVKTLDEVIDEMQSSSNSAYLDFQALDDKGFGMDVEFYPETIAANINKKLAKGENFTTDVLTHAGNPKIKHLDMPELEGYYEVYDPKNGKIAKIVPSKYDADELVYNNKWLAYKPIGGNSPKTLKTVNKINP